MDLSLAHRTVLNTRVLAATGELDMATSVRFQTELCRMVDANAARATILDLRGAASVESIGIGIIVGALARATRQGGDLLLVVDPKSRLSVMLRESRLDRAFAVFETTLEAAESLR